MIAVFVQTPFSDVMHWRFWEYGYCGCNSTCSKWPMCLFWFELAWDIHRQDQILQFPNSRDVCLSKFVMETNSDTFFWHFFVEISAQSTCFWTKKCSEVFPRLWCHGLGGVSSQQDQEVRSVRGGKKQSWLWVKSFVWSCLHMVALSVRGENTKKKSRNSNCWTHPVASVASGLQRHLAKPDALQIHIMLQRIA